MPFYLEDARGLTPGAAGALLSLYPLMMVFFAPLGGWLADKWQVPAVALLGSLLIAIGSLLGATLKLNAPLTVYIISTPFDRHRKRLVSIPHWRRGHVGGAKSATWHCRQL